MPRTTLGWGPWISTALALAACTGGRRGGGEGDDDTDVVDRDAATDTDDALPEPADGEPDAAASPDPEPDPSSGCDGNYTLVMLYGNGAAAIANNWSWATLAAEVRCGGAPAEGVPVTWEVIEGTSVVSETEATAPAISMAIASGADGVSRIVWRHPSGMLQMQESNEPGRVRASTANGASVEYLVTTFNPGSNFPQSPAARILVPEGGGNFTDLGTAAAGATWTGALQVVIGNATGWQTGQAVANIAIRVIPDTPGALRCFGDTVLTGADGVATCDLEVVGPAGEQRFDLDVGSGLLHWEGLRVTVTN